MRHCASVASHEDVEINRAGTDSIFSVRLSQGAQNQITSFRNKPISASITKSEVTGVRLLPIIRALFLFSRKRQQRSELTLAQANTRKAAQSGYSRRAGYVVSARHNDAAVSLKRDSAGHVHFAAGSGMGYQGELVFDGAPFHGALKPGETVTNEIVLRTAGKFFIQTRFRCQKTFCKNPHHRFVQTCYVRWSEQPYPDIVGEDDLSAAFRLSSRGRKLRPRYMGHSNQGSRALVKRSG